MMSAAEPSAEETLQLIYTQLPALGALLSAGGSLYALASQLNLYRDASESVWRFLVRLEARLIQHALLNPAQGCEA
jgi:hypothetical protein